MDTELPIEKQQEMLSAEIESLRVQIFEHRINIAKWEAATDDWSHQIAASEKSIADLTAAVSALTNLE